MLARLLVRLALLIEIVFAATHWVVTQDGRIAPQMDSVFQLERPHDLMAFLTQEERAMKADALREELFKKKVEFEHRDDKDSGTMIEEKLYATDPDCQKVGRKVTSMSIFESTHCSFQHYDIIFHEVMLPAKSGESEPNCLQSPLEFSMGTFEHLSSIQARTNLSMEPEMVLEKYIPDAIDLKTFANWIDFNLKKNSTSWIALNLATLYYRIIGKAREAIECCRRALHYSPREARTIALVNMGNILTHSHHHEDGIIVLHAAVDHTPSDPIAHYTLANSYALIGDLNRSVLCYENVLKLSPNLQMAVRKMHGIQCLSKLEKALENQHSILQNTLTELKDQQRKFEEWNQLQEKIVNAQASVGQRLRSQLEYQDFRHRTSKTVHDCEHYEEDGFTFFQCNIKSDMSTLETWGSAMMDLRNRLVDFQTQTDKIVDLLSLRNTAANHSSHMDSSQTLATATMTTNSQEISQEEENSHFQLTESELKRCQMLTIPAPQQMPSVLLPPEAVDQDVIGILNHRIGLQLDEDHPLPWYPPTCEKYPLQLLPYDELPSIKYRHENKKRIRDIAVQRHLLRYARTDVDDLVFTEEEGIQSTASFAQVGQRILTALRNKAGKNWILYTLAGLYWRGHGRASNSIECFRQALASVPEEQKHVPLVNLAGLLLKLGHVRDALEVASAARQCDQIDPNLNALFGLISLRRGNYSEAVHQFRRVLRSGRDLFLNRQDMEHYKLIAACYLKEEVATQHMQCQDLGMDSSYRTILRCSKSEDTDQGNCEAEVQGRSSNPASLEVAAIADTDDSGDENGLLESLLTEPNLIDSEGQEESLPEGLLRMGKVLPPLPLTLEQCQGQRIRLRSQFTSTWLSVSAKNIDFKGMLPKPTPSSKQIDEPLCDSAFPVTMATFDHLTGVRHRDKIDYRAERALEEALNALFFDKGRIDTDEVARRLSHALKHNATSWVLSTAASLYWRVKGNGKNAIDCLRIALHQAPHSFKDIPLISLANILHRARYYTDALVAVYMALEISPTFVVIHFTAGNIHAARGDIARALSFYQSTLALQPSFEPARQHLIELQCKQLLLEQQSG